MIDFHCHLDLLPDPVNVASIIEDKGIDVVAVTTTPKAWLGNKFITNHTTRIKLSLGLHPELASSRHQELELFKEFIKDTEFVGEIGLDGSPRNIYNLNIQIQVFKEILRISADNHGKIFNIHSRGAVAETLNITKEFGDAGKFVLHWFSGNSDELKDAVGRKYWFSVGPRMVKNKKGESIVRYVPRDKLLTETDCPFVKDRNGVVMPWQLETTYDVIATIWKTTRNDAIEQVEENFKNITSKD